MTQVLRQALRDGLILAGERGVLTRVSAASGIPATTLNLQMFSVDWMLTAPQDQRLFDALEAHGMLSTSTEDDSNGG